MKSIELTTPGQFTLREVPAPPPPGPGEAQVRIHRVGICGTDLHAFQGNQPYFKYPRVLGHELAAEVVSLGANVGGSLAVGDRCCLVPYLNCGTCGPCRRGMPNCCERLEVLGVHRDGGMAELINVPADKLIKAALKDEELALVEMLSIGAHAVRRAQITPGEAVLVVGAGPIGLGVALSAKRAGARVIIMDVNEQRLAFAQQNMGIEDCVNARQDPLEQLKAIIPNDLPTVVLDATGNQGSMTQSFKYVANGGRLVFVGLVPGDISFSDPDFHRRELTILATRNATAQDFSRVIQGLEAGEIDAKQWVTHHATPEQIVEQFPRWLDPQNQVIKAMLTF